MIMHVFHVIELPNCSHMQYLLDSFSDEFYRKCGRSKRHSHQPKDSIKEWDRSQDMLSAFFIANPSFLYFWPNHPSDGELHEQQGAYTNLSGNLLLGHARGPHHKEPRFVHKHLSDELRLVDRKLLSPRPQQHQSNHCKLTTDRGMRAESR